MNSQLQRPTVWGLAPKLMVATAATLAMPTLARAEIPFNPNIVADVAEQVTPAVVNITTVQNRRNTRGPRSFRELFGRRGGGGGFGPQMGAGSGVVISADGTIVTNNHVVEDADEITVTFADKREFKAKLVGTDKPSDLAFLKIDAKNLPFLKFGDSRTLRLGEFVLAVGNPFRVGQTVTMGIVSATGRANMGIVEYEDFIQTDASINPGNSGGALVNLRGELVGINTAILSRSGGAQGIGFAVPSTMVQPIKQQIEKFGRVRRGWLGVGIQDLTPDLARSLKLDQVDGVLVSDVLNGGPASKSELSAGDIIVAVDGQETADSAKLRNRIALTRPGSRTKLDVLRNGKRKNIYVTLEEKDGEGAVAQSSSGSDDLLGGIEIQPLDKDLRQRFRVPARLSGVVVMDVASGSPGDRASLRPGDVIVEAQQRKVRSVRDFRAVLKKAKDNILLRVFREGRMVFVVLNR